MNRRDTNRGNGGIPLLDWRPLPGRRRSQRPHGEQTARPPQPDDRPAPLPAHVGAWLDRYLWEGAKPKDDKPGRMALLESAIDALRSGKPAIETWRTGYSWWKQRFGDTTKGVQRTSFIVEATSRILLHVNSGASTTDGAVLLHHTWGVPYLPGSALKGLVRAAMQQGSLRCRFPVDDTAVLGDLLGQGPTAGSSEESKERAAFVDFLDAPWALPDPWPNDEWSPLALDVVTPHHSRYYTRSNDRPFPTDFDEPIPTHRLSISPGTQFHVAIEADESFPHEWLAFVKEVLLTALEHDGIGAWTTSGYGRLRRRP